VEETAIEFQVDKKERISAESRKGTPGRRARRAGEVQERKLRTEQLPPLWSLTCAQPVTSSSLKRRFWSTPAQLWLR
jgi:hypothetical protein